ncbi:hypothetical protein ACLOJK_006698 [Asimina triloba]
MKKKKKKTIDLRHPQQPISLSQSERSETDAFPPALGLIRLLPYTKSWYFSLIISRATLPPLFSLHIWIVSFDSSAFYPFSSTECNDPYPDLLPILIFPLISWGGAFFSLAPSECNHLFPDTLDERQVKLEDDEERLTAIDNHNSNSKRCVSGVYL